MRSIRGADRRIRRQLLQISSRPSRSPPLAKRPIMEENGYGSSSATDPSTVVQIAVMQDDDELQQPEDKGSKITEPEQVTLEVELRRGSQVGVEDTTPVRLCCVGAELQAPNAAGAPETRITETPPGTPETPRGVRFAEADAAEAERLDRMRANTREALQLVDRLCELQQGQTEAKQRTPVARPKPPAAVVEPTRRRRSSTDADEVIGGVRAALNAGVHALAKADSAAEDKQARVQLDEGADLDVECVSVSSRLLSAPTDCVLVPGGQLLIVDSELGLSLICLKTRALAHQCGPPADGAWRNAHAACMGADGADGQAMVYVLLDYDVSGDNKQQSEAQSAASGTDARKPRSAAKGTRLIPEAAFEPLRPIAENDAENGGQVPQDTSGDAAPQTPTRAPEYARYICRFALPDMRLLDRIEAPKWLRDRVVTSCRLCFVPQTQCLYLVANTPNQGFLYELHVPSGKWTECAGTRRHRNYADAHAFAVVGPVTELLLVETNRCYVQLVSIYGSAIVSDRTLGLCERPGALCVDEQGNLLVHDRANSKVGLHSRAFLQKCGDVALVDRAHCRLAARAGVLAVLCSLTRELRLHRYSPDQWSRERAEADASATPGVW